MEHDARDPHGRSRLTLSWRVSLLIVSLLVVSAIASTAFAARSIQSELYAQSQEAAGNVHASVAAFIQSEFDGIAMYRLQTLERRKSALRDVAAPLLGSIDELRLAAADGELTPAEAQARALDLVTKVRFANSDYFFAYDRDLNAIAHPDPRFQGRNLTDLQDADGKYVLREIRDVALSQGSGYVDYRWQRLNGAEPAPKIGYVIHYEPWDWIIGTGVYVDDIDAEVQRKTDELTEGLQQTLDKISFAGEGFFLVLNRSGNVVASGNPNVTAALQTSDGSAAIDAILAAAPTSPGIEVERTVTAAWATTSTEPWSVRISTTGGDPDWVLVSAIPQQVLQSPGRTLAMQLIGLSIVILLIGLLLGILVSRRITKPVDDISAAARDLARGTFDPATLDTAARRTDEVGDLARTFQAMGIEIAQRERLLREQVQQLTVQIDRAKVAQEVQEITESEYFQKLKSRSQELRRRDS